MMSKQKHVAGILAEFDSVDALTKACEKVRDAGFKKWDSHTPFPVHGLEKAMGLKASVLPWFVLVLGITGAMFALFFQWWVSVVDYPLIISGKPLFSWQAFVPITFEVMVLFSAFGCFFGMLGLNQLPRYNHPVFSSKNFSRFSDDRFFIAIDSNDPLFEDQKTESLLQKIGALNTETLRAD
jgi:hypothetical protein